MILDGEPRWASEGACQAFGAEQWMLLVVKVTLGVDPVILVSARKHGVADEEALHAYRNPIRVFDLDDLIMLVGPDRSAALLEIGVAHAEGIDFIVHAMPARAKFLE